MNGDRLLYKADEVTRQLRRMTDEILTELPYDATDIVLVPILDGALSTAMRMVNFIEEKYSGCAPCMGGPNIEMCPIRITRSRGTELIPPTLADFKWSEADFKDRFVIIIDDLVDEGETLKMAYNELKKFGPSHLNTLVLVKKSDIDTSAFLTHSCFEMGLTVEEARRHWLYGCGMDINGEGRRLPDIFERVIPA